MALDPTPASDAALALGLKARARGDLIAAAAAGQQAVREAPEDPRGWVLLGSLVHLQGSLVRAAELYRRALAAAPADPRAHAALAVALVQSGQPVTARAHFAAASGAGLERWSALRIRRQANALATMPADASPRPWDACTTPLFEAAGDPCRLSPGTGDWAPGRVTWSVERLAAALRERPRVVALTGAGMSVASGLETRKQLWQRFVRDEAVSAVRFHDEPRTLWEVVRAFWGDAAPRPNPAHESLARLPGLHAVITQNVDGLHQAAAVGAAAPVLELHGSLLRTRCTRCDAPGDAAPTLARGELPPRCACGAPMRPDVVLFGERVPAAVLAAAAQLAAEATLLLVIGCAMDVSPASELPVLAAAAGATVVEIKRRPSRLSDVVRVHHVAGAAEVVLPALEVLYARG